MVGDLSRVLRDTGAEEEPGDGPAPASGGGAPLPLELTAAQWTDLHARWRQGGSPPEAALVITLNGAAVATGRVRVDTRTFEAPCTPS